MKLATILIVFFASGIGLGEEKSCLDSSFNIKVQGTGLFWGFLPNILSVEKKYCVMSIYHERFKFLKSKWIVDVCREPVHIKTRKWSMSKVVKKYPFCEGEGEDFCREFDNIKKVIQDDGLIFAEGEKENVSSEHGKLHCSYRLLKKYLSEGKVLSRWVSP